MAQSDFDRMMALNGVGSSKTDTTLNPTSVLNKQASVEEMSKMKQVLLGNEQTQRAIVTADQQGNDLAQDEQIQDALYMDPFEFAVKYGVAAYNQRQRIRDAYSALEADQRLARSTGEAVKDSGWAALNGINQLIGTIPTLGMQAYDSIGNLTETAADAVLPDNWVNYEPMAPAVSNVFDKLGQTNRELQSETQQTKLDQFGLQQALDAADRQADYESGNINWMQNQIGGVTDTLRNMASVPEVITDTAANAAGSLLPFAAAIRTTAKATVLAGLSKEGITGVQAQAYLRTAAGQKAVQEASIKVVPTLSGIVGSGSAANQAQVAILSMTDETLESLPDYAQLRSEGLDNDAIRNRLASQAGNVAALPGAVIGYVAGFINRGFDAAPLRTGGTTALSSAVRGATNVPREMIQEFVEEGFANQFAANVGVASVDPNQSLDEGVAEAGTMGAVGGGISGAGMQAPGVALAATKLTGKLAIDGLSATGRTLLSGIDTVTAARANKEDRKSQTGINATTVAIESISNAVNQIAELEIDETDTVRKEIVQEIADAITVPKSDKYFAKWLAAADNANISDVNPHMATKILNAMSGVINITSDTLREKIDALDEADPIREIYANIFEDMKTVESATILEKSQEVIRSLSPDAIKKLIKLDKLSDEKTSEEEKKEITQAAAGMARVNPQVLNDQEWNIVLNQMSPEDAGKMSQNDRAAVTAARDNAQISVQTEAKKSNNESRLQNIFEKLPTVKKEAEQTLRERLKKTVAGVKIDIRGKIHKTEKTGKASLVQYVANTNQLMSEGKVNAAQDLLTNLYEFARGQRNKVETLNKAVKDGATGAKYGFQTWDGSKRTDPNDPKGLKVFVNAKSPASLVFALDVDADTREVIDTYNTLRNAYPELNTLPQIEAPLLSGQIDTLLDNFTEERDLAIKEAPAKPVKESTKEDISDAEAKGKEDGKKTKGLMTHTLNATRKAIAENMGEEAAKAYEKAVKSVYEAPKTEETSSEEMSNEAKSEIRDIATLLDLLGVEVKEGDTKIPTESKLLDAYNRLKNIFNDVAADKNKLSDHKNEIANLFSWVKNDLSTPNKERRERAVKSAKKRGANEESSYISQLAEETIELIVELGSNINPEELEVIKRELKVLRFGADTVIKQDGLYKGLTNQEALDKALQARDGKPKTEETSTPESSEKLILISPSNAVEMKAAKKALKEFKKQYRELEKEWRKIWNTDSKAKKPLIAELIGKGLKIAPNGSVGKELYAAGVTSRTAPGLFKKSGLDSLDNLVQEDWEQALPGIAEATDSEISDGGYLNQDGLIALIAEEVAGNTDWLYSRQQVSDLDGAIEYLEGKLEGIEDEIKLLEIEQKTGRTPNEQRNAQNDAAERTVGTDDRAAEDRIGSVPEPEEEADSAEESQAADTSNQGPSEQEPKLNVWAGTGENAEFSNLSPRAFKDSAGREYFSVEHAYQSLKSGKFDESTYEKYSKGQSRKIAGRKGTKTEDNYNIRLMEKLIFESFRQNPEAAQKLIDTGKAVFTHTQDKGVWKKAFPEALMKAREKLKKVESPAPANREEIVNSLNDLRDFAPNMDLAFHVTNRPDDIIKEGFQQGGVMVGQPHHDYGYGDYIVIFDLRAVKEKFKIDEEEDLRTKFKGRAQEPDHSSDFASKLYADAGFALDGEKPIAIIHVNEVPELKRMREGGARAEEQGVTGNEAIEAEFFNKLDYAYLTKKSKEEIENIPGFEQFFENYDDALNYFKSLDEVKLYKDYPAKEIKRTPLKDALTNLFGGVANKIATVFKRKEEGSDLLDMENIAEELTKRFAENNKSEEANKDFATIMKRALPFLEKHIADYVSFDEKRAEYFLKNSDLKDKPNLRILELFDQDTLKLNKKVSMALAMAASEWLAELNYGAYTTDRDKLNKLFPGRRADEEITEAVKRAADFGGSDRQTALVMLSNKIQNILGIQENKDANPEDAQGIFGALAATTLGALKEAGMIETAEFVTEKIEEPNKKPRYAQMRFAVRPNSENKDTVILRKYMRVLNMPFSAALKIDSDKFHIGKPPEFVKDRTRRNKFSFLTALMRNALKANQNIEHKLNTPLVSVVDALGTETLASLLGHVEIKEKEMHPEHVRSQRGKNQTIETSLESLEIWRELIRNYAEENDMEIEDVPVHFEASLGSNGRTNQIAPSNVPQSDKLLRELLVPSETVVDMSDETAMTSFWAGISQALGGKIEKFPSFDDVKADAQERLSERQETIGYLKKLLLDGALSEADGKKLKAQLKNSDFDMKILHALLAEAARQNAVDQNAKEFVTHLTIEADGVTDGPINAILNLLTPSNITPQLLEIMASGGLIFGDDQATLDDYYNRGSVDLYSMIAEKLGARLKNDVKNNSRVAAIMDIADGFLDGLDRDKGSLIIDRALVKNPITVFLYNSSPSGIADSLVDLTGKNFYALMTKIKQSKETVFTDSSLYKENQTALKNYMAFADPRYANKRIKDSEVNNFYKFPLKIKIDEDALKQEYLNVFVNPLLDAINDTLPGLKDNMNLLQKIATTQTKLFQTVFKEKADALQKKLGRSLSQDDLETVLKQSLKVAPIFYTASMGLEISELKPAKTKKIIAQDFKEKVNFLETSKAPADAGKKMVPNYVVATGDGQVIASVYANAKNNLMDKSIQVFDGIEMSIDTFSDGSEHINKQVFNNWVSTNIYEEVQRSIDQVVSIKDLSPEAQKLQAELKKFITPRNSKKSPLDEKIDSSKKLKKIVQDFPSSTDHLAGAKRSYVNEGTESLAGIAAFDFEAMAKIMDGSFQEPLPEKSADGVAKPSKAFMDKVKQFGSAVKGHEKVLQIKGSALTGILNSKEFTKDQKLVFAQIMKRDKIFNDYTFYFGDAADLEALRDGMYPDLAKSPISLGQTFTAEPVALIANMSPETLLHEMLHATLALRIISVKKEPEKFTVEIQKALQTLEGLKTRFLNMDITSIPDLEQDEREAFTAMQAQINAAETEVEALSEFLSWSMSNKALIDKAKRTKIHKPLVQIILKILQTAKDFLGFVKRPGVDMFSNIVYNTAWLTRTYTPLSPAPNKVFEQRYGPNAHIEQVESIFTERLNHFIEGAADELRPNVIAIEKQYREAKIANLQFDAVKAIEKLNHNFFRLDQRQSNTFAAIYASLGTGFKIDSSAMQEATQLYNQVIDKLTAKDFVADWARSSQAEKDQAQAKLDALIDEPPITMIALAQVDESFSNVLSKLRSDPDAVSTEGSQIDRVIRNIATSVGNNLSKLLTTTRDNSKPVNQQLAALTVAMAEIQKERRFVAESFVMNAQMKADKWAADKIYDASGAASTKLENIANQYEQQSKIISKLAMGASFVTGMANRDRSKQMLDKLQSELNKARSFDWFQALVADLRSDRPDMIRIGKALNKVRDMADRVRQHQKDLRIKYMKAAFSKKLTAQDNKDFFMGLGRTDLSSIGRENVLALLRNPETVTQRLNDAKRELRQLSPQYFNAYMGKIKSLANYMMTWNNDTPNLLRNAHAIGYLLNENNRPRGTIDNRVLALISQITSLEAFDSLSSNTKTNLKNLMVNETEGMQIVVGNLAEVHSDEFGRRIEGREGEISLKNGWKGYLPMNFGQGQEVIIADDRDQAKLEQEGWVRIRSYSGDPRENNPPSRGLYQTTVGGKGQFRQGILQTVHKQWHGVDPRNGVTNSSQATSGFLTGAAATRVSQSNAQARTGQDVDYMMPVFDGENRVMGYEYSIPMRDLEGSAPEMDLIESLGSWFGRIEEEEVSGQLNKAAVLQQKAIYDKEYSESNADEWINVADPDIEDAIYKDAWSVLGWETKGNAAEAFGAANFFPVKRAEIDSMIGYRLANPKDLWTGVSRIDEDTRKIMRDTISLVFGKNTYTYINKGYGAVTSAVSWAKVNIIIRSGIVPLGNTISNSMHLQSWGLGIGAQLARMPKKLKEISRVVRIQEEIGKLTTELPSIINNQAKVKRIKAKIAALEAEQEAMSIWPILQANEFSTISESLTRADVALRQGSMFDWLEKQTDKLPSLVGDITKTSILAKDTELFRTMHHFMQYGDFIAKSMLYDHLLETQQKTPDEALDIISVEYVNYNRPAGRWRDALEASGMLWFSNYALRITPILLNLLRDRPVSALIYGGAIAPAMDIDTVISGSAPGKIWRDVLGYSFGPGMGFRSIQLNPIINSVF